MKSNAIIETINLTKKYEQGNETIFGLQDMNIKINKGEITAIVGRSGSGKSTLLNVLGGIDTVTDGRIMIADEEITKMKDKELTNFRNKHIGFIFQNYNLINELTVLENIRLPLDLLSLDYDTEYENELITLLELENRLKFRPNQLSGGQQQRVAIARALITKPDIVLADEPTGNLDKKTGDAFVDFIIETNKQWQQTYIIVTHNMEVAVRANRIITIEDGTVIKDVIN